MPEDLRVTSGGDMETLTFTCAVNLFFSPHAGSRALWPGSSRSRLPDRGVSESFEAESPRVGEGRGRFR